MTDAKTWHPEPRHFEKAHALKLAASMGLQDYDSLLKLSIEEPERYWFVAIDYLGIKWDTPPVSYVDLSRGKEFPSWFPGGKLNWVNTVLGFGEAPETADQLALVAEEEDGSVARATYAELKDKVRRFAAGLRARGITRGELHEAGAVSAAPRRGRTASTGSGGPGRRMAQGPKRVA